MSANTWLARKCVLLSMLLLIGGPIVAGVSMDRDLFLGVWSPMGNKWESRVPVCIWNEDGDILYRVTATGLRPGNRFALTNGVNGTVSYRVFWHTGKKFRRSERLRSGTASKGIFSFETSRQCIQGPNAQLRVRVNKREIDNAIPGIYDDTLFLTLSPL